MGATGALLGSLLTGIFAIRNETRRQRDARQFAYAQKVREQVGKGLHALFNLHHSMAWFTWYAQSAPSRLDDARISQYDEEMHEAIPRLMSEFAKVASLNYEIWHTCVEAIDGVLDLEEQVALSGSRLLTPDRDQAITELAALHDNLRPVMKQAVNRVAGIMRDAEDLLHGPGSPSTRRGAR